MIDKLRKKMIGISGVALIMVFLTIFATIYFISLRQLGTTMDILTDRISEGGGVFHPFDKNNPRPPDMDRFPGFFTDETPFSTRFFVVRFDINGNVVSEDVGAVSSVTKEAARKYAIDVLERKSEKGWKDNYRYRVSETPFGKAIVFVDGSMNRATTRTMLIISGCVLVGSMMVILFLIILLSKRAVRPMAESYEKQKQFVTDANHELKTPLTLILTNLDILESETGKNEWLDDIRTEGQRMSALVNQLTALSRLDEDQLQMQFVKFSLSDMVGDTVAEFMSLADARGLTLHSTVLSDVEYVGDEGMLRRVMSILLDNAVKYCDPSGDILVLLVVGRYVTLSIENSCYGVDQIELHRLFDRFYRIDKARTSGSGFGIGLSQAQAIVLSHGGEIISYKAGQGRIGFKVILK